MADDPDIIQKLSVDFNVVNDITIDFNATPQPVLVGVNSNAEVNAAFNSDEAISAEFASNVQPFEAQFGTVYVVGGDCRVLYATTATWNSQPQLISARGYIYIYADYRQNGQGQNIPAMKVGDGNAYLIDLPFVDSLIYEHIADNIRHISQQEREFWNNKVRCYIDPEVQGDNLIFTTQ